MKPADRELLFDEMMKGALEVCRGNPHELILYEESSRADLDAIEPVIDEIIAREKLEALKDADAGWQEGGLSLRVVPDGVCAMVHVRFQAHHFVVRIDRSRLRDFGNYLMLEAAK